MQGLKLLSSVAGTGKPSFIMLVSLILGIQQYACHLSPSFLRPARTGFLGKIYAEPTRELYHALGMDIETLATTPSNQEKRGYILAAGSIPKRTLTSIWVRSPSNWIGRYACQCLSAAHLLSWKGGPFKEPFINRQTGPHLSTRG